MTIFGFFSGATKFQLAELEWKRGLKNPLSANWEAQEGTAFTSDATVSENYNFSTELTKFPVQGGYPVTDMSGTTGFAVTITAVNTNSSGSLLDTLLDPLQAIGNSPLGSLLSDIETSVQAAYNTLERWSNRGQPLELRTTYAKEGYKENDGQIAPFLISGLSIIRNADTGDSLGWTCILERVFISQTSLLQAQGIIQIKGEQGITSPSNSAVGKNADKTGALGEADENVVQGSGDSMGRLIETFSDTVGTTP
jgi:hypothetical protein